MSKKMFAILFILSAGAMAFAQDLPIGTGDWAPYTGEKLFNGGFANDVLVQSFKQEGQSTKLVYEPWVRVEAELADGKFLASPGWTIKEDRKAKFLFSGKPLMVDHNVCIYFADSKFDWKTKDDLKKYAGASHKSDYQFAELVKLGVKMTGLDDYKQGVTMLLAKRFDFYVINETVGRQLIRTLSPADQAKVKIHPLPYDETIYYLMFSRKYPDVQKYLDSFNSGFDKLRKSGKYDQMIKDLAAGKYD